MIRSVVVFLLTSCGTAAKSQKPVAFVTYQSKSDLLSDKFNHWFTPTHVISNIDLTYERPKKFSIVENDKLIETTDTVKYAKEYKAFLQTMVDAQNKYRQPVRYRAYNSNVLQRAQYGIGSIETKYLVLDTLAEMSPWTVMDDTLTILGFTCQKAITNFKGTKYIAYFSVHLPFSSGPQNFRGLPGLILAVQSESGKTGYYATEITYPFKGSVPKFDTTGTIISQKEFLQIANQENEKTMGKMGSPRLQTAAKNP